MSQDRAIYAYEGAKHAEWWWAVGKPAGDLAVEIRKLFPTRAAARAAKRKGERVAKALITFAVEETA
jgi:hypothetical protein